MLCLIAAIKESGKEIKQKAFNLFFPIPTQTKETPIRESIKAAAYQYIEIIDLHWTTFVRATRRLTTRKSSRLCLALQEERQEKLCHHFSTHRLVVIKIW